jgi:hypothetical protein
VANYFLRARLTRSRFTVFVLAGDDPVNNSDPSGACTSWQDALQYRLCVAYDEGLELQLLFGSYTVSEPEAEVILSINGQTKLGQPRETALSFEGEIHLGRLPQDTELWRYTTSDEHYGEGWFLSPTYYQSSSLVADKLALPISNAPYEYVWEAFNPLPALALYGEVAPKPEWNDEKGGGEQVVPLSPEPPTWEHHLFGAVDIELTSVITSGPC